jgi:site-specific recombinase XerD
MANLALGFIFDEVLAALSKLGLSEGSILQYTRYFRKMQRFFLENEASEYSEKLLDEYWLSVTQKAIPYSQKYLSAIRKSIYIIRKYAEGEGVSCSFITRGIRYNPSQYFQELIDGSIEFFLLEGEIRKWYSSVTRKFCCLLEERGISNFFSLRLFDVSQIMTIFGDSNSNSMGLVTSSISKFFLFLHMRDLCTLQIEPTLYTPCKRRKLIPAYSDGEIRKILEACDKSTKIGKRNYAILLLATTCGLRRSDISGLTLSDIDWKSYVIRFSQKKTGKALSLPMPAETGNAVAEYILEGRQVGTQYNRVFLTSTAPVRPLESSAFNDLLSRICKKASIPKIPGQDFHSLRRSAGTLMAVSGVPVTTISQVLGHSDCNSANRYISANPAMISCSLDFTGIPVTSEVYK